MVYPHSHKTVLVLDHTAVFSRPSQQMVDFDAVTKSRGIPLQPVGKSLWTCNVEACMEFSRIIYDIFPTDRLISLIASNVHEAECLTGWKTQEQSLQHQMTALGSLPPPDIKEPADTSIMHGLTKAIKMLCEATPKQEELLKTQPDLKNKGRIICLTSFKSLDRIKVLEDATDLAIRSHNQLASSKPNLLPIEHCDLILLHVDPINQHGNITARSAVKISPQLQSELQPTLSGPHIAHKLVELAIQHFDLASTTITGIPMKEEQNASSSANYDVELLHSMEAHTELFKTGGHLDEIVIPSKEGLRIQTICLKWCTPKSISSELQQCHGAYRITPVDVNSRPSSCLTNFLLNGRAVMLEQQRKSGSKVISHMLSCHGGEIYIHVLGMFRSILEDPPSISEGCGGRVTDYRIKDFGELMKESRLAPAADASHLEELPIERAKGQLERMTRHWPMVIGDTIIFNMLSHLDPLPSLIVNESLSEDDVKDCRRAILYLVDLESRNENLPIPNSGTRGKGPKREEQYRQMWRECEKLVRCHANNSPQHAEVLECLLHCKGSTGPPSPKSEVKTENGSKDEENTYDQSMKTLERQMTEREKKDFNTIKKETDSPPVKKIKSEVIPRASAGSPESVLSIWMNKMAAKCSKRHAEFSGRIDSKGSKAELYKNPKPEPM
ncbi:hypothetical protein CAPTEDRAFT_125637 [Capitella teleta]|uniref:Protein asunder n=1 Tax=Capitella teleta TaxID=283909 RepID=R7U2V4_CAPTE|nr:hypothetical protein CAPTEDRAFT_125637 [Capitella teleta]|eukprot:ELU00680.1 hypothetical protein CAPTEDRAFT_125637 [Capitella teleta]